MQTATKKFDSCIKEKYHYKQEEITRNIMDEQTQNIATALKWCRDENQKLRQEVYDLNQEVNDRVVIEDIADAFGSDEGGDFDWEEEIIGMRLAKAELRQGVYDLKQEKKVLEEQLKQQNEWFQEIIRLVGGDPSDLAVNAVRDYVREHS